MHRLAYLLLLVPLLANAQVINRVEYYFDLDPGPGNGSPALLPPLAPDLSFGFNVALGSVSEGFHMLYFRAKSAGKWSLPLSRPVFVERTAQTSSVSFINRLEYFFDTDPGPGNGDEILFTPAVNISLGPTLPFTSIPEGFHLLYFRSRNTAGFWSHPVARPVFVQRNAQTTSSPSLTMIEYFFDMDLGPGNRTTIPLSSPAVDQSILVDLSGVSPGFHVLYMRSRDTNGRWSLLTSRPFVAEFSGDIITALEYFFTDGTTTSPILSFADFSPGTDVTINFAAVLSALSPSTAYEIHIVGLNARGQHSAISVHAFTTPAVLCDPLSIPTTTGADLCGTGILSLVASGAAAGQTYRWYTSPTGGTPISGATASSFATPVLSSTTTYYAVILNGTCESNRAPVTATILNCNTAPEINSIQVTTPAGSTLVIPILPLVSDAENNVDTTSLRVVESPISTAPTSVSNGVLTISYSGMNFAGSDYLTLEMCDVAGACAQQIIYIEVVGDLVFYNAISPNGDGKNDQLVIQYIDLFPETRNNKLIIFNRWGDIVFETVNYDNTNNAFLGLNQGGKELPTGTYYYRLEFPGGSAARTGFISIRR